jgi:hypothetical protein
MFNRVLPLMDSQLFASEELKNVSGMKVRSGLEDAVFVLGQLSPPNIVPFMNLIETSDQKFIMQFCQRGELSRTVSSVDQS